MKSPMTPDDPRLTAYALGELSPSERPEIEAALRDSAECRAAVSEIRQVAESLQVGLGAEPCPQLSPERKESVLRAVPAPEPSAHRSPSTPGWWMLWGPRLGWGVAGAAVASLVWLLQPSAPLAHLPSQQEQTAQPAETVPPSWASTVSTGHKWVQINQPAETVPPTATTGLALATSQEPATNVVVPLTARSNIVAVTPSSTSPVAPPVLVVKPAPGVVIVPTNLSAPEVPSTPVVARAPEVVVVAVPPPEMNPPPAVAPAEPPALAGLVPLALNLPAPAFKGTPTDPPPDTTAEKPKGPRPAFLAPTGCINLAAKKKVTSSDKAPITGSLDLVTDGNKEATDVSTVELHRRTQWVQIDLEGKCSLYAILIWHNHNTPCIYRDVIVQVSDDPDFIQEVTTLFNSDNDNSSGLGIGTDREYFETNEGKLVDAKGLQARFVRCYSKGSTDSALNVYTEIEVFGLPQR